MPKGEAVNFSARCIISFTMVLHKGLTLLLLYDTRCNRVGCILRHPTSSLSHQHRNECDRQGGGADNMAGCHVCTVPRMPGSTYVQIHQLTYAGKRPEGHRTTPAHKCAGRTFCLPATMADPDSETQHMSQVSLSHPAASASH